MTTTHITHPRLYELGVTTGFLGRRRRVYDGLVSLSGAAPGDRVLDVGCGTGFLTRRVAKAVGPEGKVVGVDPSPPMVAYARRVSPSNCDYRIAGGEAIPEPDGSFDVAVSSFAVHHIPIQVQTQAMAELFRLVRPGGRVMLADFRGSHHGLSHSLLRLFRKRVGQHVVPDINGLLTDAGFTITGEGDVWPMLRYVQATRP